MKRLIAALAITVALPAGAFAQYPEKPVTLVVPYSAGGNTDVMVRMVADQMSAVMGQSFVVTNQTGGSGVVGMSAALMSQPDGYTVGLYASNTLVSLATGAAPFTFEDIKPGCMFAEATLALTTSPDGPNDMADLGATEGAGIAIQRGTLSHFGGLMFNEATSTNLKLVDTGDGAQKKVAVMGGHLQAMIDPLNAVIQDDAAGLLKVIAVFAPERLPQAQNIPTAVEQGFDITLAQANGFMFPKGTPDEVVDTFCSALGEAAASPAFTEQMGKLNVEVKFLAGQEYADYMNDLYGRIGNLAQAAGF